MLIGDLGQIFRAHDLFAAKSGKHQAHQIGAGRFNGEARGKRGGSIEIINAPGLAVGLQQLVDCVVLALVHCNQSMRRLRAGSKYKLDEGLNR